MNCRPGCGACCIAISISSPLPQLPNGKAAGQRCPHLADDMKCKLFGHPSRPAVCSQFQAEPLFCGETAEEAMQIITDMEREHNGMRHSSLR